MCERFSEPIQTGSGAHLITYEKGNGSFPGVKLPGLGLDHPPISGVEIQEIVGLLPLWAFGAVLS